LRPALKQIKFGGGDRSGSSSSRSSESSSSSSSSSGGSSSGNTNALARDWQGHTDFHGVERYSKSDFVEKNADDTGADDSGGSGDVSASEPPTSIDASSAATYNGSDDDDKNGDSDNKENRDIEVNADRVVLVPSSTPGINDRAGRTIMEKIDVRQQTSVSIMAPFMEMMNHR
jgi:hypothetical protein